MPARRAAPRVRARRPGSCPGCRPLPPARTSVTKNGLPAVLACRSPGRRRAARRASPPRRARAAGARCAAPRRRSRGLRARSAAGGPAQLVGAVGDDHERAELLDASPEHAEDVERRLVGPVHVLEHDDRRGARAQLVQERDDHALRGVADECRIRPVGRRRPARCRRAVRADEACAARRTRRRAPARPRRVGAERANEGALPDPRIARDEDEPPLTAPSRRERVLERGERRIPLEKVGSRTPFRCRFTVHADHAPPRSAEEQRRAPVPTTAPAGPPWAAGVTRGVTGPSGIRGYSLWTRDTMSPPQDRA